MEPELLERVRALIAAEDDVTAAARDRGQQVCPVPLPEVGGLLAWVAATTLARHVVEIGSAAGLTGLWLVRGMADRGVLTSIEPDPHVHGLAAQAYDEAGIADRVRAILGDAVEVLPRLSDDTYELVLVQGRVTDYPVYLEHGRRLLKPGGVLAARGLLHDPDTARGTAIRAFTAMLDEHDELVGCVLPLDDGVGVATLVG